MKDTEHTPGPRELCNLGDYRGFNGRSRVILGDDMRLAAIHATDDEGDANARLIAAAPDMLGALKAIVALAPDSGPLWRGGEEMRLARKALLKAEGGAP